jgi:hypothetical protein
MEQLLLAGLLIITRVITCDNREFRRRVKKYIQNGK